MDPLWLLCASAIAGLAGGYFAPIQLNLFWTTVILIFLFITAQVVSHSENLILQATTWVFFWAFVAGLSLGSVHDIYKFMQTKTSAF